MTLTHGPELDAAVAKACDIEGSHDYECVYGENGHSDYKCTNCGDEISHTPDRKDYRTPCVKPYSTDLNAAIEAAEKCGLFAFKKYKDNLIIYRGHFANPDCWCIGTSQYLDDMKATGRTLPLAICSAILAIHGKADA